MITYAFLCSSLQVDLVGTNAEASNNEQVVSLVKDLLGELSLGTDTNDVYVADLFNELVANKGFAVSFDLRVGVAM